MVVGSNPTRPAIIKIMFEKIKKFVMEVIVELKKVSWTTRSELKDSTLIVIISSAFLGIFIVITDFILSKIVGFLIK